MPHFSPGTRSLTLSEVGNVSSSVLPFPASLAVVMRSATKICWEEGNFEEKLLLSWYQGETEAGNRTPLSSCPGSRGDVWSCGSDTAAVGQGQCSHGGENDKGVDPCWSTG